MTNIEMVDEPVDEGRRVDEEPVDDCPTARVRRGPVDVARSVDAEPVKTVIVLLERESTG